MSGRMMLTAGVAAALLAVGVAGAETRRVVLRGGEDLYGEVTTAGGVVTVVSPGGQPRRLLESDVLSIESLGPAPGEASAPGGSALAGDGAAWDPPPGSGPPPSPVQPWYRAQRWALGAAVVAVLALFGAGAARGEPPGLRGHLRRARVLLLFLALLAVGIYALDLQQRREARTEWARPLHVAVVLLEKAPLDPMVVARFRARAAAASEHLAAERRRYARSPGRPFWFHVFGPVPAGDGPPPAAASDGLLDRLTARYHTGRYLSEVDAAAGCDADRYDLRLYVVAAPPGGPRAPRFVEGRGESGGELGFVTVTLDPAMVDAAWIAALHEMLHTVGATDKYDAGGRSVAPDGLAEPQRVPPYPQTYGEIMAGEIPTSPTTGLLLDRLEAARVGPATAREIRW